MWQKWSQFALSHLPALILTLIVVLVIGTNIQPDTWLSGWDTLHPEWDLALYFRRAFFGAWQSYQGLGAPAAQAWLSELPRLPLIGLLQILPQNLIRYVFIFFCYALGGVGVYLFLSQKWFGAERRPRDRQWLGFLGAIFYLFHLITLQHFYVILEMFAVSFAALPWMLWTLHNFLEKPTAKNALIFFSVQFLASSSAHTPTLFYANSLLIGIYSFVYLITNNHIFSWKTKVFQLLGRMSAIIFLVFCANAFWFLPNLDFVLRHSSDVATASVNQSFSPEAFWYNQAWGNLGDVLLGKNYLFSWRDYDFHTQQMTPLFDEWQQWWHLTHFDWLFYFTSLLSLVGMWLGWERIRWRFAPVIVAWLSATFFLINLNFPTAPLYELLRSFPLVSEGLRLVWTKFSLFYLLMITLAWAEIARWLLVQASQQNFIIKINHPRAIMVSLLSFLILLPFIPMGFGHFLSDKLKVDYPPEYAHLREFLSAQPATSRILTLPLLSASNWQYFDWGFQGGGFIWFGVPQAVMEREFDRWASSNETAFNQLFWAYLHQDASQFATLLDQYQVEWLLLDQSLIDINRELVVSAAQTAQMLNDLGATVAWQEGNLILYHRPLDLPMETFLSTPPTNSLAETRPWSDATSLTSQVNYLDKQVIINGGDIQNGHTIVLPARASGDTWATLARFDYDGIQLTVRFIKYTLEAGNVSATLPQLPDTTILIDNSPSEILILAGNNHHFPLAVGETRYENLTTTVGEAVKLAYYDLDEEWNYPTETGYVLRHSSEKPIDYQVNWPDLIKDQKIIVNNGGALRLVVPTEFLIPLGLSDREPLNCDYAQRGNISVEPLGESSWIQKAANHGAACNTLAAPQFAANQEYLLHVVGENIRGLSARLYVRDDFAPRDLLEQLLNDGKIDTTLLLRRWDSQTVGKKTLVVKSESLGTYQTSENLFLALVALPIDWGFLSQIAITPSQTTAQLAADEAARGQLLLSNATRDHSYLYRAQLHNQSRTPQLLVLSQTYDEGWHINVPHAEHLQYRDWANAWLIPAGYRGEVVIEYRPQRLTWIGMSITAVTLVILTFYTWHQEKIRLHRHRRLLSLFK